MPATELREYVGTYPAPDMPIAFVISMDDGKLFLVLETNRQELVPVDQDVFASVEGGGISFERNAIGKVTTLVLGEQKLPRKE